MTDGDIEGRRILKPTIKSDLEEKKPASIYKPSYIDNLLNSKLISCPPINPKCGIKCSKVLSVASSIDDNQT